MGRCSDARERVLCAAGQLFHERGYSAVSVADICAAAGVQKGSFYHFFPSKRDLVLEALDRYAEGYRGRMAEIDASAPAVDQLRSICSGMTQKMRENHGSGGPLRGCPVGNLALEMAARDDAIREKLDVVFSQWRQGVAQIFRAGTQRGEFAGIDPDTAAESFIAAVQGATLLAKASADPHVFERITTSFIDSLTTSAPLAAEVRP